MFAGLFLAPAYLVQIAVTVAAAMTVFVLAYSYFAWRQERGH